jgi:putative Holliday junction resolvase
VRYLALDVGEKRIGVAVSDPLGIAARGLAVVKRTDLPADLTEIARHAREAGAESIVVGLPVEMDGKERDPARRVRDFARRVEEATGLPVVLWDETLTTVAAEEELSRRRVPVRERRGVVDQVAAAAILQEFLDERAREGEGG